MRLLHMRRAFSQLQHLQVAVVIDDPAVLACNEVKARRDAVPQLTNFIKAKIQTGPKVQAALLKS
jgi:hypothetical protein